MSRKLTAQEALALLDAPDSPVAVDTIRDGRDALPDISHATKELLRHLKKDARKARTGCG